MTGQTQTTVERIQREIGQYYGHGPTAPKISFLSQTIAAEIDRLTAERDEARAIADARVGDLMNANGIYIDELKAQLAEARAEVGRLRPAAEAWEAAEKWRAVGMHIENRRGRDDAYQEMDRAAARAREARK